MFKQCQPLSFQTFYSKYINSERAKFEFPIFVSRQFKLRSKWICGMEIYRTSVWSYCKDKLPVVIIVMTHWHFFDNSLIGRCLWCIWRLWEAIFFMQIEQNSNESNRRKRSSMCVSNGCRTDTDAEKIVKWFLCRIRC